MRTLLLATLALTALPACERRAVVHEVTVAEAALKLTAGTATPVDANDDEYRTYAGHVPGAVLLTNFARYPLHELPQDKGRALVFYCTSRL